MKTEVSTTGLRYLSRLKPKTPMTESEIGYITGLYRDPSALRANIEEWILAGLMDMEKNGRAAHYTVTRDVSDLGETVESLRRGGFAIRYGYAGLRLLKPKKETAPYLGSLAHDWMKPRS